MYTPILATCILAVLTFAFSLQAMADEQPANPIHIQGLVSITNEGLILHDGTRTFLLIGVDNIGIEGRACSIFGELIQVRGVPAIDVFEVHLIKDEDRSDDTDGLRKVRHPLPRMVLFQLIQACQASPYALSMPGLRSLDLQNGAEQSGDHSLSYPGHRTHLVPSILTTA